MKNLLDNLPDFTFTTGEMTDILLLGLRYTSLKRSSNIVDFPVHALTLYVTQPSSQRTPSYDFFIHNLICLLILSQYGCIFGLGI